MDVVQERDGNNVTTVNYTRSGNIGGLLARSDGTGNSFFSYDGSGNVVGLTNAAQASVAEYSYDAWGNTLRATGAMASVNAYRYSTKELQASSGLYDYGFRFYSPGLGRWINRDPLEEDGGLNLYAMVGNDPVNETDTYGLAPGDWWDPRSYTSVPSELNLLNPNGSLRNSYDSIYEGGAALLHGDTARGATAYSYGLLGQTDNSGYEYYATRGSLAVAGTAAAAAGGLMACEAAGVSKIGSDITFHLGRYPNAGGGGFNIANQGVRKFGLDVHRFKYSNGLLKGQWARWYHRIHGHWEGAAKSAIKWHRELWTGRKL